MESPPIPLTLREQRNEVAIFWDIENIRVPSNRNSFDIARRIRDIALEYGPIQLFKAYDQLDWNTRLAVRTGLQASGVSVTDCPHNGRKEVADKMMLADIMTLGFDPHGPCTFVVITSDRDYAYTLAKLTFRQRKVILISSQTAAPLLNGQATARLDWTEVVVNHCPVITPQKSPSMKSARKSSLSSENPRPAPPTATPSVESTSAQDGKIKAASPKALSGTPSYCEVASTSPKAKPAAQSTKPVEPSTNMKGSSPAAKKTTPAKRKAETNASHSAPPATDPSAESKKRRKRPHWRGKHEKLEARAESATTPAIAPVPVPVAALASPPPSITSSVSAPLNAEDAYKDETATSVSVSQPAVIRPSPPALDGDIFDRLVEVMLGLHYEDKITISIAELWERLQPCQQATFGKIDPPEVTMASSAQAQDREGKKRQFKTYIKAAIKADILRTGETSKGVSTVLLAPRWRIASVSA